MWAQPAAASTSPHASVLVQTGEASALARSDATTARHKQEAKALGIN
jgi:hypothetical protein